MAPLDAEALTEYLRNHSVLQPVVAMGSEVHDEAIAGCVAVDSRAQASLLAGAIVDSGARHCRIYLPHRLRRAGPAAAGGLTEALEEGQGGDGHRYFGVRFFRLGARYSSGGFGRSVLWRPWPKLPEEAPLYGMGVSGSVLELLEAGRICALAAVNEYDLGYLTLSAAAGLVSGRYQPQSC